ncbi:MAG: BamA/TamA family outer membrane protein, partial [Synechococcaceae cyanobacterium SM2_3_60]|nr:BamA/TamA family outer membrane protein [Synechococcaceae cyanobacterium SM2_3_60]
MPDDVLTEAFEGQVGAVLNFGDLQAGVSFLEDWYVNNGYVLAQVADVRTEASGAVVIEVSEGEIEDIRVDGNTKTRDFIVTRELSLQPGDIFNRDAVQDDLQRVFDLNLFQDVNLSLEPGSSDGRVIATVSVEERNTGALSAGAGVSSSTGTFGTISLSEQNLGGNAQRASLDIQLGTQETLYDINYTNPWIAHWETPTAYNVSIYSRINRNNIYNDGQDIRRRGVGISFSRNLSPNLRASLGFQQQFVGIRNQIAGNQLAFNEIEGDNYTSIRFGLVADNRDSTERATSGSIFRISSDQSVRLLANGITSNRLETSYSRYIPVNFGAFPNRNADGQEVLALDVRLGTVIGALAPYDAFLLGGGNSVRGWAEG